MKHGKEDTGAVATAKVAPTREGWGGEPGKIRERGPGAGAGAGAETPYADVEAGAAAAADATAAAEAAVVRRVVRGGRVLLKFKLSPRSSRVFREKGRILS